MSSRHTRRKVAKAKQAEKLIGLAQAERSRQIAVIVRANMTAPIGEPVILTDRFGNVKVSIERNYYPSSNMGRLTSMAHRGYVCHNRTTRIAK